MTTFDPMPSAGDGIGPNTNNTGDWSPWLRDVVTRLDIRADQFNVFDPIYEGPSGPAGVGNADADTYALNACIADATSGSNNGGANGKPKLIRGRGGKRLRINSTIEWPNGLNWSGGPGSDVLTGRPFTVHWDGPAGGTMFNLTAGANGRVVETLITQIVFREGTARPGKWWEIGDETLVPAAGVDFGTHFYKCHFYSADAPAGGGCFDLRFGPTNFWLSFCRMDGWTGAAVRIAVNNSASHVTFSDMTMDNGTLGGYFFWLDNGGMGSNKDIYFTLKNVKLEVNSVLSPVKTVIRCTMDPASTSVLCHRIHLSDVHIQPAGGGGAGTDWSFVKAERTDAVDTRYIYVRADACKYLPGSARLIDGVVEPPNWGSFTGTIADWQYTPQGFGFASPGTTGFFSDLQTQQRIRDLWVGNGSYSDLAGSGSGRGLLHMHNALAVPSGNPVGGGYLYVEAGALKYRGTSGTVTTVAPA